ncbi:hypothetical protein ACFL6G_03550 [candidate division KSB1 bacterium]
MRSAIILYLLCITVLFSCGNPETTAIDQRSYNLGVIGGFSEVVNLGIKKLALSSPMAPGEMDGLIDEAEQIAERNNVSLYREEDFLVTDLFPEDVCEGKHVLLIYKGGVLDEYIALKNRKKQLLDSGSYTGKDRKAIAVEFGKLLSYPDAKIEELLQQNRN